MWHTCERAVSPHRGVESGPTEVDGIQRRGSHVFVRSPVSKILIEDGRYAVGLLGGLLFPPLLSVHSRLFISRLEFCTYSNFILGY